MGIQECQKCHHTSKNNWIGHYKLFCCEKCGFECNRDRNASINIAARASQFEHPEQRLLLQVVAQVTYSSSSSGGGAAAESTAGYVNRHDLKGEGSAITTETDPEKATRVSSHSPSGLGS